MTFTTFIDGKSKLEYYEYISGTRLSPTANVGIGTNGKWYYQIARFPASMDNFVIGDTWDVQATHKSWEYTCKMKYSGLPIQESDCIFHQIRKDHEEAEYEQKQI